MYRVSLPMYNLPEMRAENGAFWAAVRTELQLQGCAGFPALLDYERKPVPPAVEPDTLFTQVCGWPLQTIYAGQAVMLGVPVYRAAHCIGPTHAGVFVVRREAPYNSVAALRGCHFVFNSVHSNSGMNLPRRVIADLAGGRPFFASVTETHSQPGNLERVASGAADATCVDCVTFAFFARHRPHIARHLRILAATPSSPAIPFVTSVATPPALQEALRHALAQVARSSQWSQVRDGMLISDILPADAAAYRLPGDYAEQAVALGYPQLI